MHAPRCNCIYPLRGQNQEDLSGNCPVHRNSESTVSFRRPVKESTPIIQEEEEEEEEDLDEIMDEILTKLTEDKKATDERFATLLADNRKVKLKEPKEFKGEENYDINDFLAQFDKYCEFNGVKNAQKSVLFSSFLGSEPLRFYDGLDNAVKANFNLLRQSFVAEYNPANHRFYKRQQLRQRKKKEGESVREFKRDIQTQGRKLNIGEDDILQLFMEGLPNKIKEYVITQAPANLEAAYTAALAKESALISTAEGEGDSEVGKLIPILSSLAKNLTEKKPENQRLNFAKRDDISEMQKVKQRLKKLELTNNNDHQRSFQHKRIPERRNECYNCGKLGHFAKDCRSLKRNVNPQGYYNSEGTNNQRFQNQRWPQRSITVQKQVRFQPMSQQQQQPRLEPPKYPALPAPPSFRNRQSINMLRNRHRSPPERKHRSRIHNRNNQLRYQYDFQVANEPQQGYSSYWEANYQCHNMGQDEEMTSAVWIYGAKFRFLIDTGASISIVHPAIYQALWQEIVPMYYSSQRIETVSGGNTVEGEVYVDLDFKSFILEGQKLLLTYCGEYDGILGRDFLRSVKAIINIQENTMLCHGKFKIPLDFNVKEWVSNEIFDFIAEREAKEIKAREVKTQNESNSEKETDNKQPVKELNIPAERKVHIMQDVELEPFSETLMPGTTAIKPVENQDYVIENLQQFTDKYSVMCATAVTKLHNHQVPCRLLNPTAERITLYAGTNVASIEEAEVDEKVVMHMNTKPLKKLDIDLTKSDLNEQQQETLQRLFKKYRDVFAVDQSELEHTNIIEHHIDLEHNRPIRSKPYRASPQDRQKIKDHIEEMLEQGVIRESTSAYSFPVVLVKKRGRNDRFCVDYRRLNQITKKDSFPLPRIQDTLDALHGTAFFSTLDLRRVDTGRSNSMRNQNH